MANDNPHGLGGIFKVSRMLYALAWNDVHNPNDIRMEEEQLHLPQFVDIHVDIAPRNGKWQSPSVPVRFIPK
jgi:hypothetical protein